MKKLKILTVTGTRPELIRLSVILRKLDEVCEHIHVYTNQNANPNLSTLFIKELKIRKPDYTFSETESLGSFLGAGLIYFEVILKKEKPDKVLVLGDTNSGLMAIMASKMGIPVYHMEAGNRCYDGAVPEETNRKVIDACSLFNLPYTEGSKTNLINEGFHKNYIFKTGNPIKEVLDYYHEEIDNSKILERLELVTYHGNLHNGFAKDYALLSFHRTENVDCVNVSSNVTGAINEVAEEMPVIFPLHPRTKDQFKKNNIKLHENVRCIDPIGFFDFVKLEQFAKVIFTDSGTVPEETFLFGKPCIVLRSTTERQELMERGSLILAGTGKADILRAYKGIEKMEQNWEKLDDYHKPNVSDTVVRILLGQNITIERKGHDEY